MRKRWSIADLTDVSINRIDVILGHVDTLADCIDLVGSPAFSDTDAHALCSPAVCSGYAVTDDAACVVPRCVVLPADQCGEVLRTWSVLS